MPVDHFYGLTQDTFNIKFLYNLNYYQTGGPIFFYLGNEGAVEKFAQNTGIMWYLAKTFNAAVVFAEHRYYGESLPYGKLTFVDVKYLQFLSVPQVLADCATFIPWFKENVVKCNPHVPVIAFGGSYGGMLAAWFRIAYPNVTAGAWAASAPLLLFHGSGVPIDSVAQIATQTFLSSGCNFNAVVNGFQAILDLSQSNNGRNILYQIFGMSDYLSIRTSIEQAFLWLASIDYPYPTNFLKPLPEWPVELACKSLSIDSSTPEQRARAMYEASSVWNGNKEQNNFQNDENMLPNMYSWKWQVTKLRT
uniref:Uncharacterized protein n=1 Tax=Acrobeloides nanus TaxID=290746 RepID=A0A914EFT1_9BILA